MGKTVLAHCELCGFVKTKMALGASMHNFMEYSGFPYYCKECETMFVGNYKDDEQTCTSSTNIIPYNDPTMHVNKYAKLINRIFYRQKYYKEFQWGSLHLDNIHYFCPKCKTMSLKFKSTGMFD